MDWHDGLRAFARFMHSWFVTVIFAVMFIATLLGWIAVGLRFGYDRIVRGDIPMPPPASAAPVPEGWKVVADEPCVGNHCSTRKLTMHPDRTTLPAEAIDQFTKAWEQDGFKARMVNGQLVGGRDPFTVDVNWPGDAPTVEDAVVDLGFTTQSAGNAYWQNAILYKPVEKFRTRLWQLTFATIGLIVVLWLTEGIAQDPPRSSRPPPPKRQRLPMSTSS